MTTVFIVLLIDTSNADEFFDDFFSAPISSDKEHNTSLTCQTYTQQLDWLTPEQERVCLLFCWRWTCISLGTCCLYAVWVSMHYGISWWLSARQSQDIEPARPSFRPNGTPIEAHFIGEYDHPLKEAAFVAQEDWVHHPDYDEREWNVKWSRTNCRGRSNPGVAYAHYVRKTYFY